ncbi:unnamed protein product, partial [Allacma fusca]
MLADPSYGIFSRGLKTTQNILIR